jgi:3-methyladenine DNA glycosylase AlkD
MSLAALRRDLERVATPARAKTNAWFFKTGKGQYGEGDQFIGITVPELRKIAKQYSNLALPGIHNLLASKIHEERLCALLILIYRFKRKPDEVYRFYLARTSRINNWDLVDVSAPNIVGAYLLTRPRKALDHLARSKLLWDRRIAIVSTLAFIRNGELEDTFRITEILMDDQHDLIQKACGWMLRETGKKDVDALQHFLKFHAAHMPRTTLRYAIERLSPAKRARYLAIKKTAP